jgi:hypothetical protein
MTRAVFVMFAWIVSIMPAAAGPITPSTLNCITSPCIDFANITASGQISYDGNGGPLVGTGIVIENIWGFGTPQHNFQALPVQGGSLAFETGDLLSYDILTGYQFGGGGSFLITGGVADLNLAPGTMLASGSFIEAAYGPGSVALQVHMLGIDWKHEDIVEYFGLDPNQPFQFGGPVGGGFTFTTPAVVAGGGAFTTDVLSVDIPNTPVPEPGTLLLLGTGIAYVVARSRSKSRS